MRYQVTVERVERFLETVTVEAESSESAKEKVEQMIHGGDVLIRLAFADAPGVANESVLYAECQYCLDNGTGACQGYGC
jgi:hypothetical protein